eukprot:Opistho-1_new@61924
MGHYLSTAADSARAIPDRMANRQRETQLQLREIQLAMAHAQARDMVAWLGAFTATVGVLGLAAFGRTKRPFGLVPLLPLGFVTAYNYDFAYGTKIERIRDEAGRILALERSESTIRFVPPLHNLLISEEEYVRSFAKGEGEGAKGSKTRA